ncbi:MAG: hypothetical protein ACRD33_07185, partial [Candidatus Acidiferrales bacterium]
MRIRLHHISAALLAAIVFIGALAFFSPVPRALRAQTAATQTPPTKNPSAKAAEPFVIERYSTNVLFETDGTGERLQEMRVKITDDAG